VISGDYNASCSLGFQNLSFNATQLQFCQMPKSCTAYVASEARASYVDVDRITLEQYVPEDLSRYDGLLRPIGASAIRLDQGSDAEGATIAGIRFVSEVRRDLLTELKLMKRSG
jgi:hypothetical protein